MILNQNNIDLALLEGREYDKCNVHVVSKDYIEIYNDNHNTWTIQPLCLNQSLMNDCNTLNIKNIKCKYLHMISSDKNRVINGRGLNFDCDMLMLRDIDDSVLTLKNIIIKANKCECTCELNDLYRFIGSNIHTNELIMGDKFYNEWREYSKFDLVNNLHPELIMIGKNPTGYKTFLQKGIHHVENIHKIILQHEECEAECEFHHWKSNIKYLITKNKEKLISPLLKDDRGFFFGKSKWRNY